MKPILNVDKDKNYCLFMVKSTHNERLFANHLEFTAQRQYYNASFFSRPLTRSLPPWAAADPDRRLNNP
ncbi:TPA: hypothetical protein GND40_003504 [Salmonella enterica subsp. indica]|uniref:Uncharacterized protein n=2 Tax=Salmonella enterica TaxID=28901 RepID=A0A753A5K7_SALER|nr:hypothetical protein [Salmonella enterica subsp. indica serovar 11:b:e,n,x]EEM2503321.1 hypothetical protein [Salmonella enterica subsp. indica serovar 45:a:e,n,x]HAC6575934.1 hypothetical protein [Salmonella enterica subsp. indica]HAE8103340.1 hypothetical protein [Salmonella enterica subsp. indica serovar 45:a:e,n,x]HAF7947525.1 hypothetical protein [Salmonella enterica subsp. indica]